MSQTSTVGPKTIKGALDTPAVGQSCLLGKNVDAYFENSTRQTKICSVSLIEVTFYDLDGP